MMAEHYRVQKLQIDMPRNSRRRLAQGMLVFLLIMNLLLGVLSYRYARSATFLLPLAIESGFIVVLIQTPELIKRRTMVVIFSFTLSFAAAFGFGIDIARYELWSERPLNKIIIGEKGKDAETEVAARIIRSGERGVLYFDPKLNQFGLVPWDSIKRIEWPRSPLTGKL
jgi:hypothetical protein